MASTKGLQIMKEITKRIKEMNIFDRNLDKNETMATCLQYGHTLYTVILSEVFLKVGELDSYSVKIISAGNGKCTAEFTVEPEHTNMRGTLHGGMSATLVDIISTYALMTSKKEVPGVSVDMHMTYMKAAQIGDEVLIEANTIRAGNTLAFLDVVIKNKNTGDLLVTGNHTKFVAS